MANQHTPNKSGHEATKDSKVLTVRISPELHTKLSDVAWSKRLTMSDFVRLAIAKQLPTSP